jgi:hypothetical protein
VKKLLLFLLLLPFLSAQTNFNRVLSGVNYVNTNSYAFTAIDVTWPTVFRASGTTVATLSNGSVPFFGKGSIFTVVMNGSGTLVISCSGCTIAAGGTVGSTLTLTTGQGADIYGDGTNFIANIGAGSGGGGGGGSSAWASLTSGNNNSFTATVDTGASLFPINGGLLRSDSEVFTTASFSAPGTVSENHCTSMGYNTLSWIALANGTYAEQSCIDNTSATPTPLDTWVIARRTFFKDGGNAATQNGKNAFVSFNHLAGTGVSAGQDRTIWLLNETPTGDTASRFGLEGLQSEVDINGNPNWAGSSPDGEAAAGSFQVADSHTGINALGPGGFGVVAGRFSNFREAGAGTYSSCAGFPCWRGIYAEFENLSTVNGGSNAAAAITALAHDATGTNSLMQGFGVYIGQPGAQRFGIANYGEWIEAFSASSTDYDIVLNGVNSAGTSTGFNAAVGPFTFGQIAHAASGYQLDDLGPIKIKPNSGSTQAIDFFGATSGSAGIGVALAAGSPNRMLLPTSTGANGTCLSTDGGNPQQLTWIVCGGGGGGSGITTLNGLTPLIQTFTVNNAGSNVALSINSSVSVHTFSAALAGVIPAVNLPTATPQSCSTVSIPLTCSISAQNLAIGIGVGSTWGASALNQNVVQGIGTPDANIQLSILNQVLTATWASTLSVTRGGTGNSAISTDQIFVATASNTLTATSLVNGILQYRTATHDFIAASALADPTTTNGDLLQRSGGVLVRIAAPTGPNNVAEILCSTPSGGVGQLWTACLQGVAGRSVSGASDTVAATDRAGWITYTGSSATAITLPSAASFGSNFVFGVAVTGTVGGTGATLTTSTSHFQPENSSTFVILQGENCTFTSYDNVDWFHRCSPGQLVAGTNVTFTRSQFGVTINATSQFPVATRAGDIIYWDGAIWNHLAGNNSGTNFLQENSSGVPSWASPAGAGTVTSVAQTVPSWLAIAGSPITSSGTLAITAATGQTSHQVIGTCGSATSFAPCALVAADIPTLNQNTTGTASNLTAAALLPTGTTAATPSAKDNSTKLATTAYVDAPTGLTAGSSVTLTAPRQYFVCTTTCTITVPVPAAGYEFCVMNDDNVSTVITLAAIGSSSRYENTARTAYGTAGTGTFVSGGAVGDKVCILGRDSTHYVTASFNGTWTAN